MKNAKRIQHSEMCLCSEHAEQRRLPAGTYYVARERVAGSDEPIQCDDCTVRVMRTAGVL